LQPVRTVRVIPLPRVAEVLEELPRLLSASGELSPRRLHGPDGEELGDDYVYSVVSSLSPAWSNIDFEPNLARVGELDRHFVERQIERTHRDYRRATSQPSPWEVSELGIAALTDWSIQDEEEPWGVLVLEVPVFTIDRQRAVLRGQRCEYCYAEDFEHWLRKVDGRWTLTT
jgi:hypothetical protein